MCNFYTTESYRVPSEIASLQSLYAAGFEASKHSRKLTWLQSLGQATVELDLTDRIVKEECYTWQATVIWAFQSDSGTSLSRSVEELVSTLEMGEDMVRSALVFWVSKMVLTEVKIGVYAVLETLSKADRERSIAANASSTVQTTQPESAGTFGAVPGKAESGFGKEKNEMYWQFIQGMLKNSAAQMPVQQIGMMLKMLLPDGFPHGDEELKGFLNSKVDDDELEVKGGKYKLKK